MKEKEIINNLTEGEPTRAVQLPDGRWVTEKLARQIKNATKSWEGVDVDKFMDEMRGRD